MQFARSSIATDASGIFLGRGKPSAAASLSQIDTEAAPNYRAHRLVIYREVDASSEGGEESGDDGYSVDWGDDLDKGHLVKRRWTSCRHILPWKQREHNNETSKVKDINVTEETAEARIYRGGGAYQVVDSPIRVPSSRVDTKRP
ncbi:unnamed protein product, partial [Protopolystoma xenopodis]